MAVSASRNCQGPRAAGLDANQRHRLVVRHPPLPFPSIDICRSTSSLRKSLYIGEGVTNQSAFSILAVSQYANYSYVNYFCRACSSVFNIHPRFKKSSPRLFQNVTLCTLFFSLYCVSSIPVTLLLDCRKIVRSAKVARNVVNHTVVLNGTSDIRDILGNRH